MPVSRSRVLSHHLSTLSTETWVRFVFYGLALPGPCVSLGLLRRITNFAKSTGSHWVRFLGLHELSAYLSILSAEPWVRFVIYGLAPPGPSVSVGLLRMITQPLRCLGERRRNALEVEPVRPIRPVVP